MNALGSEGLTDRRKAKFTVGTQWTLAVSMDSHDPGIYSVERRRSSRWLGTRAFLDATVWAAEGRFCSDGRRSAPFAGPH